MGQIQRVDIESSMKRRAVSNPTKTRISSILTYPHPTYHIAVQSKCTINHLDGLKAMESALWMPFSHFLNSGQMKALPA